MLLRDPLAAAGTDKIAMRARWYQMRTQDRLDPVLQANALRDELGSARHLSSACKVPESGT